MVSLLGTLVAPAGAVAPTAEHGFEVELSHVTATVELGDVQRVDRKRVDDVVAAARDLASGSRKNPVALLAVAPELRSGQVAAVGQALSAAGWRVLLLVDDADPGPPPLGSLRWETLALTSESSALELIRHLDDLHGAGRACIRLEVDAASAVPVASRVDVPRRGTVAALEVRFGGTDQDAWFSMGGGTCEAGLPHASPMLLDLLQPSREADEPWVSSSVASDPVVVEPEGSALAVASVIQQSLDQLKGCYERRLRDDPTLVGAFDLVVTLQGGEVTEVTAMGDDAELGACIAEQVRGWEFPADVTRATTTFRFTTGA